MGPPARLHRGGGRAALQSFTLPPKPPPHCASSFLPALSPLPGRGEAGEAPPVCPGRSPQMPSWSGWGQAREATPSRAATDRGVLQGANEQSQHSRWQCGEVRATPGSPAHALGTGVVRKKTKAQYRDTEGDAGSHSLVCTGSQGNGHFSKCLDVRATETLGQKCSQPRTC